MSKRHAGPTRPALDCGAVVARHRHAAGLLQRELAAKAKVRVAQVSQVENGHNVEIQYYARFAKVLGFRGALEMLRAADSDPLAKHRDRAWALLDDGQKKRALRKMHELLLED